MSELKMAMSLVRLAQWAPASQRRCACEAGSSRALDAKTRERGRVEMLKRESLPQIGSESLNPTLGYSLKVANAMRRNLEYICD
jgi:hypothetical protein